MQLLHCLASLREAQQAAGSRQQQSRQDKASPYSIAVVALAAVGGPLTVDTRLICTQICAFDFISCNASKVLDP